jgi:hypothetical protein
LFVISYFIYNIAYIFPEISGYGRIWPDMAGRGPPMAVAAGIDNPIEPQNAPWVETRDPSWSLYIYIEI